ncbi:MAG: hypothetical protein FWD85_11480 [Microbacteriaceae bacterium]|nr:hypothetical protein [Microbacteriaceae bacterium]MCL2795913.1 hypothetical protein [Microbacteriaceae bacterium]
MTGQELPKGAARGTVSAVWAFALVAAVLVAVFSRSTTDGAWLGLAFGGSVVLALVIQIGTQEKRGFVSRLASSVSGALIILVVATGVIHAIH